MLCYNEAGVYIRWCVLTKEEHMLTVSDLMLSPLFRTARLAAGRSGLSNNVLYIGFLDWESVEQIPQYFQQGEIVVTTLMSAKDDIRKAEKYLKALIMNNSSAIMIKEIYYREISDEIRDFAEERHIPVFFFSEIYIDEIIHEVKKQLETDDQVAGYEVILDEIFNNPELAADASYSLVNQINSYFYSKAFMAAYISYASYAENSCTDRLLRLYDYIHNNRNLLENIKRTELNIVYSRFLYKRGILLLISFDTEDKIKVKEYGKLLLERISKNENFSDTKTGTEYGYQLEDISLIVRRAVFANVSAILSGRSFAEFDAMDSDYTIFSVMGEKSIREYCDRTEDMLLRPGAKHIPLLETALTFAECGGNVEKTAETLHQHKNTVRYRIDRIGEILKADNNMELYGKLYMFARVYKARPYLEMFFEGGQ